MALVVALMTITSCLQVTIFNEDFTASAISRSGIGSSIATDLNNELSNYGVSQNVVTSDSLQPVIKAEITALYSEDGSTSLSTAVSQVITKQAESHNLNLPGTATDVLAKKATSLISAKIGGDRLEQLAPEFQQLRHMNMMLLAASAIFLVLLVIVALAEHHFFGALGPGLFFGGLLVSLGGGFAYLIEPSVVSGMFTDAQTLILNTLNTVIISSIVTLLFVGIIEMVIGLVTLVGHHVFAKNH
ncbi:hypothetical protein DCM90_09170 [Levilactobacillus bambusae]|uniref:Uncharacterized protein n=2 Tax=Levilactobacillus bambusae TaxID=2024736 RepID=A0A2V1MXP1_9LACO|nr:hypothetical protein DCM90_09170 [Levilactobacillus bambusae]